MKRIVPNPGSDEAIELEVWRPVVGYEGRYVVSSWGNVKSMNWEGHTGVIHELTKTIRKGPRNKIGYYIARLFIGKSVRAVPVGRLVLEAFARPHADGEEQNHINGHTLDDRIENLEWVTRSENQKHAIRNGLALPPVSPTPTDSGRRYAWQHKDGRLFFGTPPMLARACRGVYMDNAYLYKMATSECYPHYKTYKGWRIIPTPSPGSDDAILLSCKCGIIDNHYGLGVTINGVTQFWINSECLIHGPGSFWTFQEDACNQTL